jgi:folate-dependent phosphoribosylglycinamide formyltransferase PurN
MLEHQVELETAGNLLYRIVAIVTDNDESNAHNIADGENPTEKKIPLIYEDFEEFMLDFSTDHDLDLDIHKKKDKKHPMMRIAYDQHVLQSLVRTSRDRGFRLDLNALAGYMLALKAPTLGYFPGQIINSHPANLAILRKDGKRMYTGDNAVLDAIAAGETETYTSIHVVREGVDTGEIIVMSRPLPVDPEAIACIDDMVLETTDQAKHNMLTQYYKERRLKKKLRTFSDWHLRKLYIRDHYADEHQDEQKHRCDYPAYLFALEQIAMGNIELRHTPYDPITEVNPLHKVIFKRDEMPYQGVELERLAA